LPGHASEADTPTTTDFEVSTRSADAAGADIRVAGELNARSVPLLLSILAAHLRAGRTDLRVDLAAATGAEVRESLGKARLLVAGRGGELRVADPQADPLAGLPD
jgi:hypothetical protein